jgi:TetR/AcrR family transcriptional regulator
MDEQLQSDNKLGAETLILAAARKVFLSKGLDGARMQDIANEAGINKALLHYYYRSKNNLYLVVVQQVFQEFFPVVFGTLTKEGSLQKNIENFFEIYIRFAMDHPDLPRFVVTEIAQRPELVENILRAPKEELLVNQISEILESSYKTGEIRHITVQDFIVNLISLSIFPILAKPIIANVFSMTENDFDLYMNTRIKSVATFFLNALK